MKIQALFSKYLYNWTILLFIFIGIIFLNIIASLISFKVDMTKDQRYSLANGTENFLSNKENIESRISIQIYLEGNLPSEITNFQNALKSKKCQILNMRAKDLNKKVKSQIGRLFSFHQIKVHLSRSFADGKILNRLRLN